jgi:hypothetical protein
VDLDKNFQTGLAVQSGSFVKRAIIKLFSIVRETETGLDIVTEAARLYALSQPEAIFNRLCKLDEVKTWLEKKYIEEKKTYFVIGYRTLLNARIVRRHEHSSKQRTGGSTDEIGITGTVAQESSEAGFETTGERIYAICYRKVCFRFLKGAENAMLGPDNRWKSVLPFREGEDNDEVVEAVTKEIDDVTAGESETISSAEYDERFVLPPTNEEEDQTDED